MKQKILDQLAKTYDQDMKLADESGLFPYAGYQEVLDVIAHDIDHVFHLYPVKILDIGIGTGKLYEKLKPQKIMLTGIDFSDSMLEIAGVRYPKAALYNHDILKGFPEELENEKFDVIVATYFFHYLPLDQMLSYLKQLSKKLTMFGRIYVGDAMFLTSAAKKQTQIQYLDQWSEFAYYHVYEQIIGRIDEHLSLSYLEVTNSSGVLIVKNYLDCTLHPQEVLVKY